MLNQEVDLRLFANISIFIAKGAIVISAVELPVMAISEHLDPWHHSSAARAKFSDTHYHVAILPTKEPDYEPIGPNSLIETDDLE